MRSLREFLETPGVRLKLVFWIGLSVGVLVLVYLARALPSWPWFSLWVFALLAALAILSLSRVRAALNLSWFAVTLLMLIGVAMILRPLSVFADVIPFAGSIVGAGCRIGEGSRLVARVTLCAGTSVGRRALLQPGAVIGRDGFGFAKDGDRWVRIPQLGAVRLGDDVEIGANTTVDRGALEDTLIADGAKLDNLIQIGHNCRIGENTAMAACSGISGSTHIGRNCTIAGAVGMAGHLRIGDGVHFTGMAMVTRSFTEPGLYSSGIPAMPSAEWRRSVARFRRLDEIAKRLKRLEEQLEKTPPKAGRESK
jgi:UDP-3-O-[3-hydroxymyristoyl] glucosamine N-acyltransferase